MYFNLMDAIGFGIMAADGEAGTVHDIYIDDVLWTTRHVAVADAGGLGTQFASVDPEAIAVLETSKRTVGVDLTKDEIAGGPDVSTDAPVSRRGHQPGDPHLRSISEVSGYRVFSDDGEIGHLDGFIADDEKWKIHFVIVETRIGGGKRKVLIGPGLINQIDFKEKRAHIDLNRDGIARSPDYDPEHPVLHEEDIRLVGRSGI